MKRPRILQPVLEIPKYIIQYHRNAMKIVHFNVRGNFASIH